MSRVRRSGLLVAALVSLSGCGSGTWLGESEDAPLPGERQAVLLIEDGIAADPRIADLRVVLPPPERNLAWPQAGGNPTHAMGHLAAADTINLAWRTGIGAGSGGSSRILTAPVVAQGKAFAVDANGRVTAVGVGDGRVAWRFEPDGRRRGDRLTGGGLAFDGGWLFLVTSTGVAYALNAETGAEIWRRELQAPVRTSPTVADGRLLIPTADSQFFALDGETGDILWRHAGLFEQAGILGGASPAVTGQIVVAAYPSGEVTALRLQDGQPIWSETVLRPRRTLAIGSITDIVGDPVIDGDRVIVAGAAGEMAAFALENGERSWSAEVTSTQTPWLAGEFIYVLTERNELVALLRQGGRVRWVSPLALLTDPDNPDSPRVRWTGPVLVGDRLLLASSEGEIVSVSPYTGEILGKASLPGPVTVPPIVADGTVFLLTDGGDLLAYR